MIKRNLYKIIVSITLLVPLPLYLFLSATLFNITPDVTFKNADSDNLIVNDGYVYTDTENVLYEGVFTQVDDNFVYYYDEEAVIKVDDGYFGIEEGELKDIKSLVIQKETSYKLPIAFFVSVFGVGIIALVVTKKMQWHKKYPRIAVLLSLSTGTVTLYLIDTIVSNLLMVFLVATLSWGAYLIEYFVHNNIIAEEDGEKKQSDVLQALKEALK